MTEHEQPMGGDRDCGADAAAYVLGALDEAEAQAFSRHIASCAVCQDEVAAFREVVTALPMAAPQLRTPRGLRKRVMQSVRSEPRTERGSRRSRRMFPSWVAPARPAIALGATAAIVIALAVAAVTSIGGGSGTRVVAANVTVAHASAQLRVSGNRGEIVVRDLPPPTAGHVYEVWLKRATGAPIPTSALFSVTSSGTADVGIPGELKGVQQVMVTQEKDGGSSVPTSAPVIAARL